ncbi:unnamed protein product [Ranitomeya imitator]|uniref:Uncharacterized protein n=1 Tax=Ranitomeya imitator TaxID=111125 RepID=A0ABN9LKF1_9NEOB|nr:unnamed protein product [Ranitomeya imitator]
MGFLWPTEQHRSTGFAKFAIYKFELQGIFGEQKERAFSKLSLVKNYLRSTMTEQQLKSLALLSIDHELASHLNFKDLITDFMKQKSESRDAGKMEAPAGKMERRPGGWNEDSQSEPALTRWHRNTRVVLKIDEYVGRLYHSDQNSHWNESAGRQIRRAHCACARHFGTWRRSGKKTDGPRQDRESFAQKNIYQGKGGIY